MGNNNNNNNINDNNNNNNNNNNINDNTYLSKLERIPLSYYGPPVSSFVHAFLMRSPCSIYVSVFEPQTPYTCPSKNLFFLPWSFSHIPVLGILSAFSSVFSLDSH